MSKKDRYGKPVAICLAVMAVCCIILTVYMLCYSDQDKTPVDTTATLIPTANAQLTIVSGKSTELDGLKPYLNDLFGADNYSVAVESNKIVTRVTVLGIAEAFTAADENADFTDWNNLLSTYTGYNIYISDLAAENGLNYPVVMYGLNDNGDILFTVSGASIAYAAIEEPKESTREEGEYYAETRGEPTLGEKNALEKAKDYLSVMPFSYEGLIQQLEYEKFSHDEAVYGAANCGADWNEQAYQKALDYLDIMAFSRDGLIDQLEYEGFTSSQAEYAADRVGY